MRHTALSLAIAAALVTAACLQKDTTSTIYLRPDGSFDWVILEQNVRSDEHDDSVRLPEEARYLDGVSRGDSDMVNSLLALGAQDVRVRWLRGTRPYAVMIDARFDSLAGVFDRLLARCEVPYASAITETGGVTTWRLRVDVGPEDSPDGSRLDQGGGEDCGDSLNGLTDALEVTIVLESGTFTAATGFIIKGTDKAAVDEKTIGENVNSTRTVELSLSWR
jgi:hypothetical protein